MISSGKSAITSRSLSIVNLATSWHQRGWREEIPTEPHWQWPGRWSATCWRLNADNRISFRPRLHKNLFLIREKQKHRDLSKRRLPGPAGWRLSDGVQLPRLSSSCFGTGREHTLNHLRRLASLRQQMDVWSCSGMHGPSAVRQSCAERDPINRYARSPRARPKASSFSLDS